jgi:NTE family protein
MPHRHETAAGRRDSLHRVDREWIRRTAMDGTASATAEKTSSHDHPITQVPMAAGTKSVNLALQGGGAHGAFTWGVLDRLLEDDRIAFDGISATSAGAMNATVLAYGFAVGGRDGARKTLTEFWRRISQAGSTSVLQPSPIDRLFGNHSLSFSPAFVALDMMTRLMSPYDFNPLNFNPLRQVLEQTVDFEVLAKAQCPVKLFISATNVHTGKVRIFERREVCVDAVLASACLPFLFQAVEIDGEHYWDGGYMGNPALYPLIYNCGSADIVVVHINPLVRKSVPRTATEILNRINEISFNSSLMREMRAISFVSKLVQEDRVKDLTLRDVLIHAIAADDVMTELGVASKLNADWRFLTHLRDVGRERAGVWLDTNFAKLGRESSVDVRATYL